MIAHHIKIWRVAMLTMAAVSVGAQSDWTDISPHKTGFITVNGVRLHYLDWGGRGATLLFLHGMGDTAHIFDELAPNFTNQYRVLGLTRRGHGESEIPEKGYDTATLVEDIRQFLDALRIQRVILAGHSFAGDELSRFAVVHPDRVIKLVYLDAAYDHSRVPQSLRFKPLHGGGPENLPAKEESESLDGARRWVSRLFGEKRGRAIYSMMEGSYAVTAEYGKIKAPALAFFAIGYQKDVTRAETLPEPQRRDMQALLKAQRKYHEQESERFRKEIPNGRVVILTNAAHACFIDRADEVIREMQTFLASTEGPRSDAVNSDARSDWVDKSPDLPTPRSYMVEQSPNCEIHHVQMQGAMVPVEYGYFRATALSRARYAAMTNAFPHAQTCVGGGCVVSSDSPTNAFVYICAECRKAASIWASHHDYH